MKLSTRIFALAFINLALLAGVFLAFAHYQFHLNFSSFLVAPAEDRVRDVARSVTSDLAQTRVSNRTSLMARYAATYGVDFYLFDNDGPQLAGRPIQLPPGVKHEISLHPESEQAPPQANPPPPRREPPPPRAEKSPPRREPPPPKREPPPPRGDRPPPTREDGPPEFGLYPEPDDRPLAPPDERRPDANRPKPDPPPPPGRTPPRPPRAAVAASPGGTGSRAPDRPRPSIANAGYQTLQRSEAGLYWAMTRIPVIDPATGNLTPSTLLIVAPSFWGTPLFFDFKPWLAALAAVIAVFVLCWLPFICGLSKSISRLTVNTSRIAQGDFENHLPENRRDEIGQLSVSINRVAGRLSDFVRGQKRFLGDIAHELSAPIARIQFALGILEQRAGEDQRESVEDLREEIGQMSGLVGELLSFSKAGLDGGGKMALVEIEPLIRQAIAREASGGTPIVVEIPQSVTAIAEPNLLLRALSNLVRNAIRYAGADGPINISAKPGTCEVLITVADSGPGIPPEELDRIFTPFYRLDASRNRDTGGAGLGLAIVKSCVEASGGTVQCRNREPRGLEIEIRLKTGQA